MQRYVGVLLVVILLISNLGLALYLVNERQEVDIRDNLQNLQSIERVAKEQTEEEVYIMADTDLGKKTDAAMVAKVGYEVAFSINQGEESDIVEVLGNNGFVEYPEKSKIGYVWTPERAGIFEVTVVDEEGNKKVSRQINVNGITDEDFYQLSNIVTMEDEEGVSFSTSIVGQPKNVKGKEASPVTAFSIGEENIWTRTVKDYSHTQSMIKEGKDFILDRGTYLVRAALRDQYSIEDEDYKHMNYTKEAKDGHNIEIHSIIHEVVENANDGESDKFTVDATCSEGCKLVYAFFVSDSAGDKRVTEGENGYSESNVFTCPTTGWEYTVTVRVKHKNNSDSEAINEENRLLLPNSYEAIDSIVVKGEGIPNDIKIKNIQIEPFLLSDYYKDEKIWHSVKQTIEDMGKSGMVYVNNNNYITINVEEEGNYGYSAWVIDDGEQIMLEKVEDSGHTNKGNKFVYYPKSGGKNSVNPQETHSLYVQVTQYDEYGYVTKKITKNYTLKVE